MPDATYPWYIVVRGQELMQGDLLLGCPRFVIPPDANRLDNVLLARETINAIILTQSCDLALRTDGTWDAMDVLLAANGSA